MKKLAIFVLLLFPVAFFAQVKEYHLLINRTDEQSGESLQKTGKVVAGNVGDQKSFVTSLRDTTVRITAGTLTEVQGTLANLSSKSINLIFQRTHLRVDPNISASICDLCNCFSSSLDSLPANNACPLSPGVSKQQFSYSPIASGITDYDTLIDYVKLIALTGNPGDTASFTIRTIFAPEAAVYSSHQVTTNPNITAIYPSPLVYGNAIKVNITCPHDCSYSYSIYDGLGRSVGFGSTRQHLNLGSNTITIDALEGLSNGSYVLKLAFSDGSNDSHFFQVLR